MTDLFLFVSSVALWTLHTKLQRPWRRGDGSCSSVASCNLREALIHRKSQNANERICAVTADNVVLPSGALRADMRLHNLWHRATYVLIFAHDSDTTQETWHEVSPLQSTCVSIDNLNVVVQRRSSLKDYCPFKLDPLPGGVVQFMESNRDNAIRELQEEMGIDVLCSSHGLERVFSFPYQDDHVKVWGEFLECHYYGRTEELVLQEEEVDSVSKMTLLELKDRIKDHPDDFMPDACHAMKLYFQRRADMQVKRRLLKGYSSSDLDFYKLRPKPQVIFFDCDDCLYFDGWITAKMLTSKIDVWCIEHGLQEGEAYELYKQYGTALRGLLSEGHVEHTDEAIDQFLQTVHDIPVHELLQPDDKLRSILLQIDPSIPKFIFTASVKEHADRCLAALGIADLFVDVIDCKRCDLETKHSPHSFKRAMQVAGVMDPERCVFFDDNLKNIEAARSVGWRSVLVGTVGRDCGNPVSSDHAEHDIERIHDIRKVLPELFVPPDRE